MRMMASSSAITTLIVTVVLSAAGTAHSTASHRRTATLGGTTSGRAEPIEQLVLADLQLGDLGGDVVPVPAHRVGVPAGVVGLVGRRRRLRHEGPQRELVSLVDELGELLV